jgi:retinol dehydrogenase-12
LGKAAALQLAKRGAKIYFACRSEGRAMEALNEIKQQSGNDNLHFLQLDLGSLESVREFSRKFHELESRLDILVNNAGVLSPLVRTADGFEGNIGINHLGHFLLTNLLLDLLKKSAPSRIIVVASKLHNIGSINREDFNSDKSFAGTWRAYGTSKLCNLLFTRELSKKLEGTGVTINALCPGAVNTEATRSLNPVVKFLLNPIVKLFYKDPEAGCQTILFLSVEPSISQDSGGYYVDCKKAEPSRNAKNDDDAKWLWDKSTELTGLN